MKPYLSVFTQYSQNDKTMSKCIGLLILKVTSTARLCLKMVFKMSFYR